MAIIDKIKAKAKADVKHIVLPEGEETRNAQAAAIIAKEGLAKLTLLGNPEKVKAAAEQLEKAKKAQSSIPRRAKSAPSMQISFTSCARRRA